MLKIAYQLGVQKALQEEDLDRLVKEAQELGIDLEKLAIPGLSSLVTGAKALGSGLGTMGGAAGRAAKGLYQSTAQGLKGSSHLGAKGKAGGALFGARTSGAGKIMGDAWKGTSPLQKKMMMGTGGAGLYGM
jgi:hypothetical protein